MKNYILAIAAIAAITFTACKNDDDPIDEPEVYDATFTIVEPEDGAVFTSGDELHMEVDFEGTLALGNV